MPRQLPIACSLSAAELPARLAAVAALGRDGLIEAESAAGRARLRFRDDPALLDRLRAIVAAESECCAFLTMAVERDRGSLTLTIDGPDGAEPVVEELVQAFAGAAA